MNKPEKTENSFWKQAPEISLPLIVQSLIFMLVIWGCLAIYNSNTLGPAPLHFVGKQLLWLLVGMTGMLITQRIPFSFFRENADLISLLAFIPLLAVLMFGVRINGMKGWFSLGIVHLQPSEFAKPFFVLCLCHFGLKFKPGARRFWVMLFITCLWMLPILLEPDFGAAAIYLGTFVAIYWLSGGAGWHLAAIPALAIPALTWLLLNNNYVLSRVSGFINPNLNPLGCGWHVRQFQFTLARGGLFGTKMGKAVWTNAYLPLAHSDSVFASMAETLGFLGTIPVFLLLAAIVYCACRMALNSGNAFRQVFVSGIIAMFAIQSLTHISVNVTLFPTTGLTMPLVSYGGSSLIAMLLAFGIMFSAAAKYDKPRD